MMYSKSSRYSRSPSPYERRSDPRAVSRSRSRDASIENPGNNLYVTGLSARVSKRDLEKHFSNEGKVEDIHLVIDPWTRESRGFGFVTMSTVEEADRCVKYLDRSVLEGRVITVERAKRRRGRTPTPGRYLGLRTHDVDLLVTLPTLGAVLLDTLLNEREQDHPLLTMAATDGAGRIHDLALLTAGHLLAGVTGPTLLTGPGTANIHQITITIGEAAAIGQLPGAFHQGRSRRSYSRSISPVFRRSSRRSYSRSISPVYRRSSRRSYSRSVSPSPRRRLWRSAYRGSSRRHGYDQDGYSSRSYSRSPSESSYSRSVTPTSASPSP
ncbi:hypothetical protein RHSIM_Rhsim13G0073700 [Rhododendron simsii]|uniref:RRM domain-containing protein n=1 Tax=Rhododendron simsii TaxID=118357 RepID=A0A834FZV9_RHOSS|nr:hypothetical protein RHSIM_Rhsim13G0073700 [Rhododendron simsii]